MATQVSKSENTAPEGEKKQSSMILWIWVIALVLCAILMAYKFITS